MNFPSHELVSLSVFLLNKFNAQQERVSQKIQLIIRIGIIKISLTGPFLLFNQQIFIYHIPGTEDKENKQEKTQTLT